MKIGQQDNLGIRRYAASAFTYHGRQSRDDTETSPHHLINTYSKIIHMLGENSCEFALRMSDSIGTDTEYGDEYR